jgi:hypothetical protein
VIADLEKALASREGSLWITDAKGVRHAIAADKVAFVEVDADEQAGGVGF